MITSLFLKFFTDSMSENRNEHVTGAGIDMEDQKQAILNKYLPDLTNIQEIGFGIFEEKSDGEKVEQRVHPDAHFRGDDGKEYLVFYNNHVAELYNAVYAKLKEMLNVHYIVLSYDRSALLEKASKPSKNPNMKLPIQFWRAVGNWIGPQSYLFLPYNSMRKVMSWTNQQILGQAKILATICSQLLAIKNEYGYDMNPEKICVIVCDIQLQSFIALKNIDDYDFYYSNVEITLRTMAQSGLSDRLMADNLSLLLDQSEILFNPRQSNERTVDFCYCINRISHYTRRLERDLQNTDLETLKSLDQLRRKVNEKLLKYRFLDEINSAPILGINIERCKIIALTDTHTVIFLDRTGTRKYIKTLNQVLDTKAANITRQYSFEGLTGRQLRDLAESLHPESYNDFIESLEANIAHNKIEADDLDRQGDMHALQSCIDITKRAASWMIEKYALIAGLDGDVNTIIQWCQLFTNKQVDDFIEEQANAREITSMAHSIQDSQPIEHSEHTTTSSESESNPSSNSSPNQAVQSQSHLLTNHQSRHTSSDPNSVSSVLRSKNAESSINDIYEGMKCYKQADLIRYENRILTDRLNKVKLAQKYITEFINILKVYVLFTRYNFDDRNDFEGVIFEENKVFANARGGNDLLREYRVYEIARFHK